MHPSELVTGASRQIPQTIERVTEALAVSDRLFKRLALVTAIMMGAIIVTGGAVRLTGSGLGCPDWPNCFQHSYVAPLSFHPIIEFTNRLFTIVLSVSVGATALGSLLRRPYRRDLALLAWSLVVGIIGQIILGGLVVLFKLYPPLVMIHFLFTVAMLVDAVVLSTRAGQPSTAPVRTVTPELLWLTRLLFLTIATVIAIGTAVTGSGPHAGSDKAVRLPFSFRDVAELHAVAALFLVGLTLASLFAYRVGLAPDSVQRKGRELFVVLCMQGTLGYTQYFLHDNGFVVGLHLLGATLVVTAMTRLYMSLFHRTELRSESATPPARVAPSGVVAP